MSNTRRFRYFSDPTFLAATFCYAINRLLLKPTFSKSIPFLHNHLNDLLLIPVALPILLWLFRKCSLRRHDDFPQASEIIQWTVLWSLLFEVVFPFVFHSGTADWRDSLAYTLGGIIAGLLWSRTARH